MTMETPSAQLLLLFCSLPGRSSSQLNSTSLLQLLFELWDAEVEDVLLLLFALGCVNIHSTEHINLNGITLICHVLQHDHINSNPIPCLMYPSTTAPLYPHHSFHKPDWLTCTCWWFSPRHSVHHRVPSVRDAAASEYAGQRDYFPTAGDPSTPEQVPGRRKAMTSLQFATLRDDYCTTSVTYRGRRPGHSQG